MPTAPPIVANSSSAGAQIPFDDAVASEATQDASRAATVLRLAFAGGNRLGGARPAPGSGSSLDFKDHRPYLPGDDPRGINWQAYARSGHYILKLYEREVSPAVDLLLDGSRSMWHGTDKARRTLSLLAFLMECAGREGADLRVFFAGEERPTEIDTALLRAGRWSALPFHAPPKQEQNQPPKAPSLKGMHWRAGSLRIVISDLLFAPSTEAFPLASIRRDRGTAVLWVPFTKSEAEPDWEGELELVDCETGEKRRESADQTLRDHYRDAYRRHFQIWRADTAKSGIGMVRIPSEGQLAAALRQEAMPMGWVEMRS